MTKKNLWIIVVCLLGVVGLWCFNQPKTPIVIINVSVEKPQVSSPIILSEKLKNEIKEVDEIGELAAFVYEYQKNLDFSIAVAQHLLDHCKHPFLVAAVVARESGFREKVKSRKGAVGMGQIIPKFWLQELNKKFPGQYKNSTSLLDWRKNLVATDYILSQLLKKYNNNLNQVLRYYVGGWHPTYISDIKENLKELTLCDNSS